MEIERRIELPGNRAAAAARAMFPQSRHPTPHQAAGQPFKFTIPESLDRIKEEFQFLQAQYHSLKLECEKLASEKTEMQRHYVMVGIQDWAFSFSCNMSKYVFLAL